MIYLIGRKDNGWKADPVKIGYSKNPHKRVSELQTGHPYPLKVRKTLTGTLVDEKRLHRLLRDFNCSREWFLFDYHTVSVLNAVLRSGDIAEAEKEIEKALVEVEKKHATVVFIASRAFDEWAEQCRADIKDKQSRQRFTPKTTLDFSLTDMDRSFVLNVYERNGLI